MGNDVRQKQRAIREYQVPGLLNLVWVTDINQFIWYNDNCFIEYVLK